MEYLRSKKGGRLSPLPGHGASLRWEIYANIHMYVRWPHTGWRPAASTSRQGHTRQEALLARAAQRLKERCAAGRPPRRAPASREAERGPEGHGQASGHESQTTEASEEQAAHTAPRTWSRTRSPAARSSAQPRRRSGRAASDIKGCKEEAPVTATKGSYTIIRENRARGPSHAPGSHRLRWRGPDICDRHVWAQIFRIGELRSCSVRL